MTRTIANYANRIIEIKDGAIISDIRKAPNKNKKEEFPPKDNSRNTFAYLKDQFFEAFRMSIQAIKTHKLRSGLTMLGIIIGIASVVSVVALGKGSQEKILEDINSLGTNTIVVMPGKGFGDRNSSKYKTLTVNDAELLARQSYVDSTTPAVRTSGTLTRENISVTGQLNGVGDQYFDVTGLKPEAGRFFNKEDVKSGSAVVVIDQNTKEKLFPNTTDILGKTIIFNRQPLKIIGISQKQNASFGTTDTLTMWSPYTAVMNRITGDRNISSITVKVKDNVSMTAAEKNVIRFLTAKHGKEDFFTVNTDSIRQTIESTTNTMRLLISCIALISLVGRRYRGHEYHACFRNGTNPRDRHTHGGRSPPKQRATAVSDRSRPYMPDRRFYRRSVRFRYRVSVQHVRTGLHHVVFSHFRHSGDKLFDTDRCDFRIYSRPQRFSS